MSFNTTLAARIAAYLSAWKDPVVLALPSSVTRSGEQTLQSVAVVTGDRVLIETGVNAGIWLVQTGAWARSEDCRTTGSIRTGTCVRVTRGTYAGRVYKLETVGAITIGTTSQTWSIDITGGSADLDPVGTLNLGTVVSTTTNIGRAAAFVGVDADQLDVTVVNDEVHNVGGFDVTSSGVVGLAGAGAASMSGATVAISASAVGGMSLTTPGGGPISIQTTGAAITVDSDGTALTLTGSPVNVTGGAVTVAGTTTVASGSTAVHALAPTVVIGRTVAANRETHTLSGSSHVRTVTDNANATALTETSLAAGSSLNAAGTMTIGGTTVTLADGDGTVFASDGAGNCTLSASVDARVFAPSILIGESATGHREHHDLSTTSHRRRVYDDANALALTETCLAAGCTVAAAGTLTLSGTTAGFSGSTATNLGTTAGNTVTLSTATSTLTVNAATYNTASTTFSAYALGTMTLQAYGTALSLECNSYVMNQGPVAGTRRIQDRYPVPVVPGSAAATTVLTVTVPANTSGDWEGTIDIRNGDTNHEVYDIRFLFNAGAAAVASRDLTVTQVGTTQGTIGTVVGDVTKAADAGFVVTIQVANASGLEVAGTGRARFNS